MNLADLGKALSNSFVHFTLGGPCKREIIERVEGELDLRFPEPLRKFYLAFDGLVIEKPAVLILPLRELKQQGDLVEFAIFDGEHSIGFDVSEVNEAGQWNIVNCQTGFVMTKTFGSFLSNKLMAWVRTDRTVWREEQP